MELKERDDKAKVEHVPAMKSSDFDSILFYSSKTLPTPENKTLIPEQHATPERTALFHYAVMFPRQLEFQSFDFIEDDDIEYDCFRTVTHKATKSFYFSIMFDELYIGDDTFDKIFSKEIEINCGDKLKYKFNNGDLELYHKNIGIIGYKSSFLSHMAREIYNGAKVTFELENVLLGRFVVQYISKLKNYEDELISYLNLGLRPEPTVNPTTLLEIINVNYETSLKFGDAPLASYYIELAIQYEKEGKIQDAIDILDLYDSRYNELMAKYKKLKIAYWTPQYNSSISSMRDRILKNERKKLEKLQKEEKQQAKLLKEIEEFENTPISDVYNYLRLRTKIRLEVLDKLKENNMLDYKTISVISNKELSKLVGKTTINKIRSLYPHISE
jgi:hypothetical protein